MRLHTHLTSAQVGAALSRAQQAGLITPDIQYAVFDEYPSRTHPRAFEIQLGTYSQDSLPAGYTDQNGKSMRVRRARNASHGEARWAATWHEWGWFIAAVFDADPGSRWGTNPARSRRPWGYFSPADFNLKTHGQFADLAWELRKIPAPAPATIRSNSVPSTSTRPASLRAYRSDGTEVLPGETITDFRGQDAVFYAATQASAPGRAGKIQLDDPFGIEVYASVFFLYVHAGGGQDDASRQLAAAAAVRQYNETADPVWRLPEPGNSGQPENPASEGSPSAEEMAAEAGRLARTTAPPAPGVTQHMGYTVYAVLPAAPDSAWYVAARSERGEHVTWRAFTCAGSGDQTLFYEAGHYTSGPGSDDEALADLADRACVFSALTSLAAGMRETWQASRDAAIATLAGEHGVGRARARTGVDEATALGYAIVTWHSQGRQTRYGVSFDRMQCTYSVRRET